MSIRVMTDVWSFGPSDQGQLLVLLALADFADDRGHCWPALASVAEKARMSERRQTACLRIGSSMSETGAKRTISKRPNICFGEITRPHRNSPLSNMRTLKIISRGQV